jgi:hypothetical protein
MNIICISAHAFIVLYVVILICTIQVNDNLEHYCLYFVYPLDYFGDFYHHIVPQGMSSLIWIRRSREGWYPCLVVLYSDETHTQCFLLLKCI